MDLQRSARAFEQAKRTGKPLLVALRCIPCVECVKLDDELVNRDRRVRPLLERFVCVRVVSTNGLDLSLFQFDYDQSFAVFMLNADGTIYGRYGTRSHRTNWSDDVSVEGLAAALEGALELHQKYPGNKAELAAKKGPAPDVPSPEQYPRMRGKYGLKLNYERNVAQSCIHCHQIGDAQRQAFRDRREPIPQRVLFSYPHPKTLGLVLDRASATVVRLDRDSPAEQAGFKAGDQILTLQGQPLLSIADVQWVLQQTGPEGASLAAVVKRGEQSIELSVALPEGWRQRDDISWRTSSWGLRRMATGGMQLEEVAAADRATLGLDAAAMALRAKHVGQFGPHAAAKNAGFKQGDVIVSFDGQTNLNRETDLLAYALTSRKPGDRVPVTALRDGKRLELTLPMQD